MRCSYLSQLEKSREAVDAANIRAAYAEVMTAAVTGDSANFSKEVTIKQQTDGWITTIDWPTDIAESAKDEVKANGKATVTYTPGSNGAAGTVAVKYE